MMRLPDFSYHAPRTVAEAASLLAQHGPEAMLLSGGTDLLPNMKRRQQVPKHVIGLRQIETLSEIQNGRSLRLGAGLTLTRLLQEKRVQEQYTGLWQATAQIATAHLRNMGTLGGNICLDTRCNYYDQNYEWRQAIGFCMKKDGETCWVAPGSSTCLAVSSTDTAPALLALGARVHLVSSSGERVLPLTDLYQNDGIHYLRREADEILTQVELEPVAGRRSTYWKLRRRGAFDFPVLSVAAAAVLDGKGHVEKARVVLGAVAMRPLEAEEASGFLTGKQLTDEVIQEAAARAARLAKPMDNTDYVLHWRKRVTRQFVIYALQELRGDDMRQQRRRLARRELLPVV